MIRYFGHLPVEHGVAREAEDVARVVPVAPIHGLDAAVMAVAAPDDVGLSRISASDALRQMPDHATNLRAGWRLRRPQDRRDREPAAGVVDVHRREAALNLLLMRGVQTSRDD